MKLYDKLYKTFGGWRLFNAIGLMLIITLISVIAILKRNSMWVLLGIPLLVLFYIGIWIPPRIMYSKLKKMPEMRVQAKLVDKRRAASYGYSHYPRSAYVGRISLVFELPDRSRINFHIRFETGDRIAVNQTGILTYKERMGETLLIHFEPDDSRSDRREAI